MAKHYALITVVEAPDEMEPNAVWEAVGGKLPISPASAVVYLSDPYEVLEGPQDEYATESVMLIGNDDRRLYMFKSALEDGSEPDPRERST